MGQSKIQKKPNLARLLQLIAKNKLDLSELGLSDLSLSNHDSWSLAHQSALYNRLPPGFNQWGLFDINLDTVAHIAAVKGILPKGFHLEYPDVWDSINILCTRVSEVALANGYKL